MPKRLIPCLLLSGDRLVKTIRFKNRVYVGDPINAVRVFNDKEVDEIIVLDIDSTRLGTPINFSLLEDIASEAFMPMCYGGGIRDVAQLSVLFALGIEKASINTAAVDNPSFVTEAARIFGSQSIVGSMDVRTSRFGGDQICRAGSSRRTGIDAVTHARRLAAAGAGEILVTSVDRDGTRAGYDLRLISRVSSVLDVPVVAVGGAGSLSHISQAWEAGAAGAAAGTLFVLHGSRRGVLISYPTPAERAAL